MKRRVGERVVDVDRNESFKRRIEVGKTLMLLGNLAAGAMIFGQSAKERGFDVVTTRLGATVLVLTYVWAWKFMNKKER